MTKEPLFSEEVANRMSLFYANSCPMTRTLIESLQNHQEPESFVPCLALIAALTHNLLEKRLIEDSEMKGYCLRVLVIAIVAYDHVDPIGAFSKTSQINVGINE